MWVLAVPDINTPPSVRDGKQGERHNTTISLYELCFSYPGKMIFIIAHLIIFHCLRKRIFLTIKLCSSKVNPYIFWSGLFFLIRLWQQTKKPSVCIHHCGQLHLSQYSEIEGEAPNPSNHSSIILRAFPSPQRGEGSSLLMELVLCAQDQSRIMNSSLNNSYWGKLICFGVWRMRGVLSPASLFSLNDWCMSWNINGRHRFQSHLL